jgi:hypothetical protein
MKIVYIVLVFAALLWLWPNLVHEPLHLVALWVQGTTGQIHFDWSFPAHPYTERLGPVHGIVGGLFFLLLPSIFSFIVLFVLAARAGALLGIGLPVYLGFDLITNIAKYQNPISDFHFLVAFPGWTAIVGCLSCALLTCIAMYHGVDWKKVTTW